MTDHQAPPVDEPDAAPLRGRAEMKVEILGKFIWQTIGAILLTLFLLWALNEARGLVSMLVISFFFSLALQPAVTRLVARFGWRRGSAVGLIYLAGFIFTTLLILVLIPALVTLANEIGAKGAEWFDNVDQWLNDTFGFDFLTPQEQMDAAAGTDEAVGEWAKDIFGNVIGIATTGIGLIFNMATIAMFTFYFTADAPRIQRAVLRLFSPAAQQRIGWTWDQAIIQTGGYFYSRMILMIINGLGFFFTMVLVGMPVSLAIGLALFGGFVSVFIPAIGTYIGAAIPILITLAIQGLVSALVVLAYALIYQQLENYWLSPRISANTMSINGGVAFGAALAGGALAGPMGAFMALPIAALITSFISNFARSHEVVYRGQYDEEEARAAASDERGQADDA